MKFVIRFLIGIFFIFVGVSLTNDCTSFELKLYEINLASYFLSGIFARVIIALFFVIGIFLILHRTTKTILFSAFGLLTLLIAIYFFDNFTDEIIVLNSPILLNKTITIIALFLSLVGLFFSQSKVESKLTNKLPIKIGNYILSIGAVVFVFVSKPLFLEEFQELTEAKFTETNTVYEKLIHSDNDEIAAFFSTSCPYCELASKRLMLFQKRESNFPKVKIYFIGSQEGIDWFFDETNTNHEYQILEQEDFLTITNGSYPKFIKFQDSEPTFFYSGRTFNYTTPGVINSHN